MNFGKIASVSVCIGLMTGPLMMVAVQDRGLTADLSLMMLLETGPRAIPGWCSLNINILSSLT